MKHFLDTEFIDGFHKPLFGKRRHHIDLISIGIYREDGKELHLISNEYNYNDADDWVKENVIIPLYQDTVHGDARNQYNASNFHKRYGCSNVNITLSVLNFFGCWTDQSFWRAPSDIEIYGYYADYDWVLFCSLFGRMVDLPKGFPMYCIDLMQMLNYKVNDRLFLFSKRVKFDVVDSTSHMFTNEERINKIKQHPTFPKQSNEHNALADAKWNYELYKFLQEL